MLQDLKEKNPWKAGVFFVGKLVLFCVEQFKTPPKKKHTKTHLSNLGGVSPNLDLVRQDACCFVQNGRWMDFTSKLPWIYLFLDIFQMLGNFSSKKKTPSLRNGGFFMVMNPMGSQSVQNGGECPQEILPKLLHKALPSNQVMPVTKRREP